jgi:tryptophan synthase alpha chain
MSRIAAAVARARSGERLPLAPYVCAGDGGLARTLAVLRALERAKVALVELGVPFGDPVADGPVIQAAAERALASGTTLDGVLALVAELRRGSGGHPPSELPVVLMSYANPLWRRGLGRALAAAAAAGVDGLLAPDVPVEEGEPLAHAAHAARLEPIFFAAPTTSDERLARVVRASRGFVYAIGRFGVTGGATRFDAEALAFLARVKRAAGELPVAVGFGIATPEHVEAALGAADLAIVGSALVRRLHEAAAAAGPDPARADEAAARAAQAFVQELFPRARTR